jgi:hypothetical protein
MRRRGKRSMTLRILLAALAARKRQVAVAAISVALGSALAVTAVSLRGVPETLERELSRYGANLLLLPRPGRSLDEASLVTLDRVVASGDLESYSPLFALAAKIGEQDVAVSGVRFAQARNLHPWWSVTGAWPRDGSSALIGANAGRQARPPARRELHAQRQERGSNSSGRRPPWKRGKRREPDRR